MRSLASKPNVVAPGGSYPYARIKDNTGSNNGTPVNEEVYGDFHQFFEKVMAEAGLTANGQPENSSDGFQLNEALDVLLGTRKVVIEIGDWNMDSTGTLTVALPTVPVVGALTHTRVRNITAMIRNDADTSAIPFINGGTITVTGSNIDLARTPGDVFDAATFDSTSYNRGWIVIEYSAA